MREIQTAKVKLTSKVKHPLTFNGVEDVEQYDKIIWQKEMEYLEEYVGHMIAPGKEQWKFIYESYLEISSSCIHVNTDHTFQHTKLTIVSNDVEPITELPPPLFNLVQEFIYQQYHSLSRVKNSILETSPLLHLPFTWEGNTTELIEYTLYPFMAQKILPLEKNATQRLWIESIFLLLKQPVPKHLCQTIHKLLFRDNPFRFMHSLEKQIRQILQSDK